MDKWTKRREQAEAANKKVKFPFAPIALAVKLENERIVIALEVLPGVPIVDQHAIRFSTALWRDVTLPVEPLDAGTVPKMKPGDRVGFLGIGSVPRAKEGGDRY